MKRLLAAAKKSHVELLELRMDRFIVTHDVRGRPLLELVAGTAARGRFLFNVSISHTVRSAAASLTFDLAACQGVASPARAVAPREEAQ